MSSPNAVDVSTDVCQSRDDSADTFPSTLLRRPFGDGVDGRLASRGVKS